MLHQQRRHAGLIHADTDSVASDARLCHLEESVPNSISVANTHFVIGEAIDGEVFTELSKGEVSASELLFPILVGRSLIHEDRAVLTSMPS
jgi:hypothetical protein